MSFVPIARRAVAALLLLSAPALGAPIEAATSTARCARHASAACDPRSCPRRPRSLGLLPLLVLRLHGTEIERPLAIVVIGGVMTSTVFTLVALPTFYPLVHNLGVRCHARTQRTAW